MTCAGQDYGTCLADFFNRRAINRMTLRNQLLITATLSLFVSLALGAVMAWWFAARSVNTELQAALDVSARTAENSVRHLSGSVNSDVYLEHLVSTFDGNRHVRAALIGKNGERFKASEVFAPTSPAPDWYFNLVSVAPETRPIRLEQNTSPYVAIVLETYPNNEIGEVWHRSRDDLIIVAVFCALILLTFFITVSLGLRPLRDLSSAIKSLGRGDYGARVGEAGPPELAALAQSFNHMVSHLSLLEAKAQRLNAQLQTIQEEERADLARDLHDDVGPFLFAVNVDTAAISDLAKESGNKELAGHAQSIKDAVGHMQSHVRAILKRLRPAGLTAVGLKKAVENLVSFWGHRKGSVEFSVSIKPEIDALGPGLETVIYRVIQESISNAMRHGEASHIHVAVFMDEQNGDIVANISDNGIGMGAGNEGPGLGLSGMHERVAAHGGILTVQNNARQKGLSVSARIPYAGRNIHNIDRMSV